MTPQTTNPTETLELEARARGLAIVVGGGVVIASALAWGMAGFVASAVGTTLSIANVFVLTRFARRATALAADGAPNTAIVQLTASLAAKTAVMIGALIIVLRTTRLQTLPLALGLLVTVICLLGAGLANARAEASDQRE